RSTVNQILRFLQAQAGDFTNGLDDCNLVGTDFSQDDVELGLFFCSSSTTTSSGGSSNSDGGRSSGHTELLFHFFDQLGQFEHGHAGDGIEDFSFGSHFLELQVNIVSRFGKSFCDTAQRNLCRFLRSEEHTSELQSRENLVCR